MTLSTNLDHNSAAKFAPGPRIETSPRWVRVKFGGEIIADSKQALLLIQYGPQGLPTYYFPQTDVKIALLLPGSRQDERGELAYWHVRVGDRTAENAAWSYLDPPEALTDLEGCFSFNWGKKLTWYEEAEEVFVHARDPYKRVDVLASSRHVRVVIAGETVAESRRPFLLFETGLPTRYYLPRDDVRLALCEPSDLRTYCPYKGIASYWSVKIRNHLVENVVWSYPAPIPENPKIKDLICFYNEQVELYVDGELQPRPATPWSK
jgi:uncharacterized protein (DUF427 family)